MFSSPTKLIFKLKHTISSFGLWMSLFSNCFFFVFKWAKLFFCAVIQQYFDVLAVKIFKLNTKLQQTRPKEIVRDNRMYNIFGWRHLLLNNKRLCFPLSFFDYHLHFSYIHREDKNKIKRNQCTFCQFPNNKMVNSENLL